MSLFKYLRHKVDQKYKKNQLEAVVFRLVSWQQLMQKFDGTVSWVALVIFFPGKEIGLLYSAKLYFCSETF